MARCGVRNACDHPRRRFAGINSRAETSIPKRIAAIVISVLGFCLLAFSITYAVAHHTRTRGRDFLTQFVELRAGKSTLQDARRLASEFGGKISNRSPESRCDASDCDFRFDFFNSPAALRVIQRGRLVCFIYVKNEVVIGKELDYETVSDGTRYYRYEVFDFRGPQVRGWEYGIWRLKVDSQEATGVPHVLVVHLDPYAEGQLRKQAYSLDLACLAKIFGCRNASDFFPSAIPYHGPPYQTIAAVPGNSP